MSRRPSISCWPVLAFACLALGSAVPARAQHFESKPGEANIFAIADIQIGRGSAEVDAAVGRTVRSIMDYSRWPGPGRNRVLCILGPAKYSNSIRSFRLADGKQVTEKTLNASASDFTGCDALYLGQLDMDQMRTATKAVRGKGVLTIAENDPECRSRSMFCLTFEPKSLSFRIDIDAVSRSGLRIDPRVLRLSMSGSQ